MQFIVSEAVTVTYVGCFGCFKGRTFHPHFGVGPSPSHPNGYLQAGGEGLMTVPSK
jgi:hypothetical protein